MRRLKVLRGNGDIHEPFSRDVIEVGNKVAIQNAYKLIVSIIGKCAVYLNENHCVSHRAGETHPTSPAELDIAPRRG